MRCATAFATFPSKSPRRSANNLCRVPANPKQKALQLARRAQVRFGKAQMQLDQDGRARRESFEAAREAGATLREIGEAVGLHWTRIREIISGR